MICPECLIDGCSIILEEKDYYYQCKKCKHIEKYEVEVPLSMVEIRKLREIIEWFKNINVTTFYTPSQPYIISNVDGSLNMDIPFPFSINSDNYIVWAGKCVDCKNNEGKIIGMNTAPCLCDECRNIREKNGDNF